MRNPNAAYWSNFYSDLHELPLEPSDFAFYTVRFLQGLPEKNSYKNILDIGCGNGRDSYFLSSQGYFYKKIFWIMNLMVLMFAIFGS